MHRFISFSCAVIPSQVDRSGHQIRPDLTGNGVFFDAFLPVPAFFPPDPTGKNTGRWKQYFGRDFNVHENTKTWKVPFIGLSPEITWIWAENQAEINISLRNPTGKVRPAAGWWLKNIGFRAISRKIMQYFSSQRRTNKKRLLRISMTLSLFVGIFETITSQLIDKDL